MIEYLNKVTVQLVDGFHTEKHKTRYLRNALLRKQWAEVPLKNISPNNHDYDQLVIALNESIQLQREMDRARGNQTYYGQFVKHPKDVRKYDSLLENYFRLSDEYGGYRFHGSHPFDNYY